MIKHIVSILAWTIAANAATASAQPPAPDTSSPPYAQEAFIVEQMQTRWRFENDGTGRQELYERVKVQSPAGVEAWGQLTFPYNSANERMEVRFVKVHKADGRVVTAVMRESLPTTLELVLLAQLFAIAVALPSAMTAARREGTRADRALSTGSFVAIALPQLVLGIVLLTVFAQRLRWFPASEYTHLTESVAGKLRSMVLPTITLGLPLAGVYFRVLRNDLVTTLRSDHICFARGMGLSSRQVLWRRALRPSSMTLVSVLGLNIAALLGGVVIAEQIYGLPGLGRLLVGGVLTRQVTLVQGAVMFVAVVYLVANLLVDITLMALDPRVRLEKVAA